MVEVLKKMDKKILIIAGSIILLPIIIIILLAIIQSCSNTRITYQKYEDKMISVAEQYFSKKEKLPSKEGEVETVKLSKLVEEKYIKSAEKLLGDSSCKGSVTAKRNGEVVEENNGGFINYYVNLECDNYKTATLKEKMLSNLTTAESGLYKQGENYIFKGEDVNNYINFFGKEYRIISMNQNGLVKLLKVERETEDVYWDIKYNTEVNDSYGKNIYKDSSILRTLKNNYNVPKKMSSEEKKHIVSHSLCVDSREFKDVSINYNRTCINSLDNQIISLIDVEDFAKASLDKDCVSIDSKACRNYNYLRDLNLNSWTFVSDSSNTYDVYYLANGIIRAKEASKYNSYNIVIYIDGNERITEGKGTESSPFLLN